MTEVLHVDPARPDTRQIARAAACLRAGGLVAFPTETVYGLGAHALDRAAVRRIFEAKDRPANDPLIVHVSGIGDLPPLVTHVPDTARELASHFWPGPLTLVLRRSSAVPDDVTAGLDTVAIRVPAHPVAGALLEAARIPVAAPSANLFSRPSPTKAAHVLDDLEGRIDMVIDAGPTAHGIESTVLDLTVDPPVVLRPGAVSLEQLRQILPAARFRDTAGLASGPLPSPGLLTRHYAPRTPLSLYTGDAAAVRRALLADAHAALAAGQRVGVLGTREQLDSVRGLPAVVTDLGSDRDAPAIASRLYAALRELDAAGVDVILAHDFTDQGGLWRALRDRLRRASRQVIQAP